MGLVNRTIVHPREAYKAAIKANATAVAFVHNHPSGRTEPSPHDKEVTKALCMSGFILGIHVLDHVIISKKGFYSFSRNGCIDKDFPDNELALFSKSFTYDDEVLP